VLVRIVKAYEASEHTENDGYDEGVIVETQLASFITGGQTPSCWMEGRVGLSCRAVDWFNDRAHRIIINQFIDKSYD